MKVCGLQHVPFEGPGSIEPWLRARGAEIRVCRLYEDAALPVLDEVDLLVVMGGPMSVNDEAEHPWLIAEKAFVREAVARKLPVLGICLGAQLIASALGARVYRNTVKEIGWFPVEAVPGATGTFAFPASETVFHWHGETFDLPPGAVRLAKSAACDNQAFQFGERAIGLQFHLETTPDSAEAILAHCADELVEGPFIQSAPAMRAAPAEAYARINRLMGEVLAWLLR